MPIDTAFAPYRVAPGALAEEAARSAAEREAAPLVAAAADPLPAPLVKHALAGVAAGRAASQEEACRAADGGLAGGSGMPRACLSSPRHAARVAGEARAALAAGFAGVCLDRPDAPLTLGLLGAGFCPECQRELARHLTREYGDQFQPLDYLALARAAVAQAPGALGFASLPFGRDAWRVRNDALDRAVALHARAARDAARERGTAFDVVAQFETVGPAQLRAARHLDGAVFPPAVAPDASGFGLARILRAALGRRPCALSAPHGSASAAARLAAVAATCGLELASDEPSGEAGSAVAEVRRLARRLRRHALDPSSCEPVADCAVLYSAEADLWTAGLHRLSVERAVETLAAAHVQAPVVMRVSDAPPEAALVLAGAGALSPAEAREVERRLDGGGAVLAFGEPAAVDDMGRPGLPFLRTAPKGTGGRAVKGHLAVLPQLPEAGAGGPAALERALAAVLGRARRSVAIASPGPVLAAVHRAASATVLVHLVALDGSLAQGTTLLVGMHVAGGARRARFVSAGGTDVRLTLGPSGTSLSASLPAFRGYAVLSLAP